MQMVNLPTWEVNPNISQEWLEQEKARDPEMFNVEYGANFSEGIGAFLDSPLVEVAINHERSIIPPLRNFQGTYILSLDPAKGGRDNYTACIGHMDGIRFVVDRFHQFTPSWGEGKKKQVDVTEVEQWILEQHRAYYFRQVVLDQYNSQGTIQRLKGRVPVKELTWTAPTKTQAMSKLRELLNSGNLELYPHPRAIQELKNLTVTYRSGGTWSVSGGTGAAVDDYAMALAGAVLEGTVAVHCGWHVGVVRWG
jgi:hypothetical protein